MSKYYCCIHQISHPNMGVWFRKGKVYELTEERDEDVIIGGYRLYKHFLNTHFEEVK